MSLYQSCSLTRKRKNQAIPRKYLTSLHRCPIIKTSKGKSKADNPPAEIAVPRAADMNTIEGGRVRWASVSTPWETTWRTSYRRNDRIGDEKADAVILHCAPKKSSRRRRLIGMGASTPSREATGAEEQQVYPKGEVPKPAGRSVIGMGASTPSRARRDRR